MLLAKTLLVAGALAAAGLASPPAAAGVLQRIPEPPSAPRAATELLDVVAGTPTSFASPECFYLARGDSLAYGMQPANVDAQELRAVRCLGTTIVIEDDAGFCYFKPESEAAVSEANRRAGIRCDRVVGAGTCRQ